MSAEAAPGEPWLVVVDLQVVFADTESPWATPDLDGALPVVRRLVDAFGERVAYTRFVAPDVVEGAWRSYYEEWDFALQPPDAPLWDLVLPSGGRPVVTLPAFGKWGPELDAAVRGSRDVVLTGVSTDCCVLSTALGAVDAGVRVRVAADGCRGLTETDHQRALDAMTLYAPLIEVTDSRAVLASLGG